MGRRSKEKGRMGTIPAAFLCIIYVGVAMGVIVVSSLILKEAIDVKKNAWKDVGDSLLRQLLAKKRKNNEREEFQELVIAVTIIALLGGLIQVMVIIFKTIEKLGNFSFAIAMSICGIVSFSTFMAFVVKKAKENPEMDIFLSLQGFNFVSIPFLILLFFCAGKN